MRDQFPTGCRIDVNMDPSETYTPVLGSIGIPAFRPLSALPPPFGCWASFGARACAPSPTVGRLVFTSSLPGKIAPVIVAIRLDRMVSQFQLGELPPPFGRGMPGVQASVCPVRGPSPDAVPVGARAATQRNSCANVLAGQVGGASPPVSRKTVGVWWQRAAAIGASSVISFAGGWYMAGQGDVVPLPVRSEASGAKGASQSVMVAFAASAPAAVPLLPQAHSHVAGLASRLERQSVERISAGSTLRRAGRKHMDAARNTRSVRLRVGRPHAELAGRLALDEQAPVSSGAILQDAIGTATETQMSPVVAPDRTIVLRNHTRLISLK